MITTSYYFQNCRDGFNHIGVLYHNGEEVHRTKVHYINRTWESYTGQTAMRCACRECMAYLESLIKERAKAHTGHKRMCKEARQEYAVLLANSPFYQEVKKHYETL